jgi:hypothetical protein
MSLLRLLSIDRRLLGLWDRPPRYRQARRGMIPRFNVSPTPVGEALRDIFQNRQGVGVAGGQNRNNGNGNGKGSGNGDRHGWEDVGQMSAGWVPRVTPLGGDLRLRARRGLLGREDASRGEPALDLPVVEVVRNDLALADVEVVPGRRGATVGRSAGVFALGGVMGKWVAACSRVVSAARALF